MGNILLYGDNNKNTTTIIVPAAGGDYIFPTTNLVSEDSAALEVVKRTNDVLVKVGGISKPSIITPLVGILGFTGYVKTDDFSLTGSYKGQHVNTDWELGLDPDFVNLMDSSYNNATDLTAHTFKITDPSYKVYVRCRFRSGTYTSDWSDTVQVTTVNAYIATPALTATDTSDASNHLFTINGTVFAPVNVDMEAHIKTRWVVSLDSDFKTTLYDVKTTDLVSTVLGKTGSINIELLRGKTYYVKCKYMGEFYNSGWSNTVIISVKAITIAPVVTGPAYGVEGTTVNVIINNFNPNYKYTVLKQTGSYVIDSGVISYTLPYVDNDTDITLSVIAEDVIAGSLESPHTDFKIRVLNRAFVADTSLVFDPTTFSTAIGKTNMSFVTSGMTFNKNINIFNNHLVSSKDVIWINNKLINLKPGDILIDDLKNEIIVGTVKFAGDYINTNGGYYGTYWIVPAIPIDRVPLTLYLKHGRAVSNIAMQSITEKDFVGFGSFTVTESTSNALVSVSDDRKTLTLNIQPFVDMVLHTNLDTYLVATTNDVDGKVTLNDPLDQGVTVINALTSVVINNESATPLSSTYSNDGLTMTTTFAAGELISTRTLLVEFEVPNNHTLEIVNIPITKQG